MTRGKQWVTVDRGLELLDTPGILWPKFEDETTGLRLAFTGAVKDEIMDVETLGCYFMTFLATCYPDAWSPATSCLLFRSGKRRKTTWPTVTACWRPAPRSGACGSLGVSLTPSVWPGCSWMSTVVAS